jgi:hypothetical protein
MEVHPKERINFTTLKTNYQIYAKQCLKDSSYLSASPPDNFWSKNHMKS